MPLELPNLDDRTYNDLVAEGLSLIPTYAPEWTNHNPSDPGITLIELFAYLSEILIYRLNRVTNANKQAFLSLINGLEWKQAHPNPLDDATLNEEIRKAVLSLRQSDRAVTCADFESLAMAADPRVNRVRCVPRRNLEASAAEDRPGHVSVIVLPADAELIVKVKEYLQPRRLLTTQMHVVGPRYLQVGVQITLVLKSDAQEDLVRNQAVATLQRFFSPEQGGPDGRGWPFGRDVYVSEIYQLLDQLPGVDYVKQTGNLDEIKLDPAYGGRRIFVQGHLTAIEVQLDELIEVQINPVEIRTESPVKPYIR